MSGTDEGNSLCMMYGCHKERLSGLFYCEDHVDSQPSTKGQEPERVESVYDHIKINIEQSAKGARVTVTYDRSDHDIEVAVEDAILTYVQTIKNLKEQGLKVDE